MSEPTKRQIQKNGKECWELDYGLDGQGHRKRTFHQTETLADAEIDTYKKAAKARGEWWARLPETERQEIEVVVKQIKQRKSTLAGVWNDWQRWQRDNAQTVTTPKAYEDVVQEWGKQKIAAGKTEDYVQEATDYVFNKFGEGREKQNIHEITAPDLQQWLNYQMKPEFGGPKNGTWGVSSKLTNQSLFSSLWDLAKNQGWCSLNICDRLQKVTRPTPEVKIYPNDVVLNIMAAALSNEACHAVVGELALGFFGCMRPEEVASERPKKLGLPFEKYFGWHDIDLKHRQIVIRRDVGKKGDSRTIKMRDCCWEWLSLAKKLGNEFPPVNERKLVDQICEMIGLDEWIRDGLRKNCCTHLRAVLKNDYDVVRNCGNSIRILLRHYAELNVPESLSLAYWRISPDAVRDYMKTGKWKAALRAAAERRER